VRRHVAGGPRPTSIVYLHYEFAYQVQHDPLPAGFAEVDLHKEPGEKLGIVIKGGLRGQPGNPLDAADEGVFCVRINPGGAAARDSRIKVTCLLLGD
jgi:protein scribble